MSARYSLRPSTADDREFLQAVYASTREHERELAGWPEEQWQQFVTHQFDLQDTDYRRNNPAAEFLVIECEGEDVGRLYLRRDEDRLHLIDLALLPPWRGRGIGTSIFQDLMAEAAGSDRAVTIYVEEANPARRLYECLGFHNVEALGLYVLMRWKEGENKSN